MRINVFGLAFMAVILVPNLVFALRCREGFAHPPTNRALELLEQIGRFGCFAFMILPGPGFGFSSDEALALYLIVDALLALAYCVIWIVCFRRPGIFRTLSLSILPSILFLFSGVMSHSILLTLSSLIFAPSHIAISSQSAR